MTCNHTVQLFGENGDHIGSWKLVDDQSGKRYVCSECDRFYGYVIERDDDEKPKRKRGKKE